METSLYRSKFVEHKTKKDNKTFLSFGWFS
jgi:hypothetical protein